MNKIVLAQEGKLKLATYKDLRRRETAEFVGLLSHNWLPPKALAYTYSTPIIQLAYLIRWEIYLTTLKHYKKTKL